LAEPGDPAPHAQAILPGSDFMIIDDVTLLWFGLTALPVALVAVGTRSTP
jgi:hypothetical protein